MRRSSSGWLPLLAACLQVEVCATRLVSSYCTNNHCNETVLLANAEVLPGFSVTTYQLDSSGTIKLCASDNNACTWDGDVETFNMEAQAAGNGALVAVPLVFNNAGKMISDFREMVASARVNETVQYLVTEAVNYGYSTISLDLEPSCWDSLASNCQWPTSADIADFHSFIDDLATSLHEVSRRLTVTAGSYPISQCDEGFAQAAMCTSGWTDRCASDQLNVSTCNCCGFTQWFEPKGLCATLADLVVNMDTYQDAPFDPVTFTGAHQWYTNAGCKTSKLAIGLLTGEATDQGDIDEMFQLIEETGVSELDIWANAWDTDVPSMWQKGLKTFLSSSS